MQNVPVSDFPKRRFEHPNVQNNKQEEVHEEAPIEAGQSALEENNRPPRNISITMRTKQENALVEFPLESNRDKRKGASRQRQKPL